jgi:alpha-beta hydrolase superfamily lysophospholipase
MTPDNQDHHLVAPPAASLVEDVPCELLPVELADEYTGAARLFEANNATRAVVYLHGIQSHGGWFLRSCDFLRRQGITALAPDRRGSGLNSQNRGHCDSPAQLIADVDCCVDWLRRRTDSKKVSLVAVSWSGKLALAYAYKFPEKLHSLALVAPGLCPKIDVALTDKIAIGAHGLVNPASPHPIPLKDPALFTQNHSMQTFIENDPLKLTHATASFFIAGARLDKSIRKIAAKIKVPIYLFLAQFDRIIDNQATQKLLLPILEPVDNSGMPARIYQNAHHTLDFEPDPYPFFNQLAGCLQ